MNFADSTYGTPATSTPTEFTMGSGNGAGAEWNTTWNGSLKGTIPEGAVITLKIYADSTMKELIDSAEYTLTYK